MLIFANGERHECPFLTFDDSESLIRFVLTDVDFTQAALICADKSKMSEIRTNTTAFIGYTNIKAMYPHDAGGICCLMTGGTHRAI